MRYSSLLRSDQTLFRDPEVFESTYTPEHLHHRDAQVRELAFLIRPALRGASPMNAILRGPPGTGKTTTVRRVFAEVAAETRRVVPVYVNCRQDHTLLAVYRCISRHLSGYAPPSRHLDDVREVIAARLRERDARLLVCLDDADYLIAAGTYNVLLYQLLRLYEGWSDLRGAGVFAVTSDLALNLYAEADGPVRSVFHPTEVNFWPYTKTEIRGILSDRVRQGLYPGVVPATVLDLVVEMTAGEQDVRVGIALLRQACLQAEGDSRRRVTRKDVMDVVAGVGSPALAARTTGLSSGERALLYRIAEQSLSGAEMMAGAVFEEVQDYLAVGKTTYHARLRRLADAGIIDLLHTGKGYEVFLRYAPDEVFAACARGGPGDQSPGCPRKG
ncbi:Cell division control protein 6 [Methanoculleus bourgensis MS2]|uniref:ORC1-type DNA replication protein n=1 Tax=Methanoculleus bourgensis (strain ATCC 43281 / DSM 3045 / OCM 15 / MS2) TaxID=1201294 RepID=I7KDM1_METBM|nr:AAA family ATPase [Methanoculleus bourgensis]CCJ37006.1 Cell division control protein 6 [Methanoculleus bourgensis MS2]